MVFHHILGFPNRFHNEFSWTINFFINSGGHSLALELYIGRFFRTCVGIYAFISGYGFNQISKNNTLGLKENYKESFKRMGKIYSIFWLVYILFIPIGIVLGYINPSFKDLIESFFGVDENIIFEWWYLSTYLFMLLIYPICDYLLNQYDSLCLSKTGKWLARGIGIILLFGLYKITNANVYIVIFVWGILFSRYSIFDAINKKVMRDSRSIYVGIVAIIISLILRNVFNARIDMVVIPILIYGIIILLNKKKLNRVRNLFCYLGKYSIFIWLVHSFFTYYYFQDISLIPKYSLLICIWVLLISLGVSIIICKIYLRLKGVFKNICKGL